MYALYKSQSGNRIDHDAAGNLVADKDGYLYDYDGENRIVRISRGDGDSTPTTVAEFVYDALGRRINLEYCPLRAQTQPAGQSLGLTGRQTALHPGPSTIP